MLILLLLSPLLSPLLLASVGEAGGAVILLVSAHRSVVLASVVDVPLTTTKHLLVEVVPGHTRRQDHITLAAPQPVAHGGLSRFPHYAA